MTSLYELIKQKSQQKGRPLKIIADWDECLHPLKAADIYDCSGSEHNFKDFFELFWERAVMRNSSELPVPGKVFTQSNNVIRIEGEGKEAEKIRRAFENHKKILKEIRILKNKKPSLEEYKKEVNNIKRKYGVKNPTSTRPSVYPFLSAAEDLLQCLKEGLISELVIISSYMKGRISASVKMKREEFAKTWGKFPQSKLELTEIAIIGDKKLPRRWEVLRDKYHDFDILVDDSSPIVSQSQQNLPGDKIFFLTDYKCNRSTTGINIFHIKTTVSDLKDQDFALAALELKINKLEQGIKKEATKKSFSPSFLIPLLGIIFLVFILFLLRRRKRTK